MDFFEIKVKKSSKKKNTLIIYPDFTVSKTTDLMVKGKTFYAIWDYEKSCWSTDEYDVQRLVDKELKEFKKENSFDSHEVEVAYMRDFSSGSWKEFRKYVQLLSDNAHLLDSKIIFADKKLEKKDYASRKLSYNLEKGDTSAYDELVSILYSPEERLKFEWAIGSIIDGASKYIQKFLVFYGPPGSGKSTIMNIIQKMFDGYCTSFDAKSLVSSNNAFATEVFKSNPLLAIQQDGDLSKIEDNAKINSIISHEKMTLNEKYKPTYVSSINCMLFMGTNKPVRISDSKSGIIRRLIDVNPTGNTIEIKKYNELMSKIEFEFGAIAYKCYNIFKDLGPNYYNNYRPLNMMYKTDVFFNFIEDNFADFDNDKGITLKAAYTMYKVYCDETNADYVLPMYKFREELKNYFDHYLDQYVNNVDGKHLRKYFYGFKKEKFLENKLVKDSFDENKDSLKLYSTNSLLDEELKDMPAQYASGDDEIPNAKWINAKTTLKMIDTKELHYVKVPENHIVIDFDLKDEKGNKCLQRNLEEASKWPTTYAEYSKSGKGIHLHYIYDGDASKLNRIYDTDIEIKVFTGNSALRRKLSKCNNVPIAHISSGLPLKKEKEKTMLNVNAFNGEKVLRATIEKALRKEIHPDTTSNVNFIKKILDDAYNSGEKYDVSDLMPKIIAFANNSTHQAKKCLETVAEMKFKSEENNSIVNETKDYASDSIIFFDVEVFSNLFIVCWKKRGKENACVKMINPTPAEIAELVKFKLIGFNCRRYDNHILYGRMIGETNEELFIRSQKIIQNNKNGLFGEAYNISHADIYDYTTLKQSLKKYQIQLGLNHVENNLPWNKPAPEDKWDEIADYCCNDVITTEAVFENEDRQQDFIAREILADISGLTVNDTTQSHTAKIIFGNNKNPQDKFVYTNLATGERTDGTKDIVNFPGYTFDNGKSIYKGVEVGEGGYVYAEPGIYKNVALIDVSSMHPSSLINENLFGPYTEKFADLKKARILIKHKDFDSAGKMFDGKLSKYLTDSNQAKQLSNALKIVINSVYGFTSAKFDNKFRDIRNVDNIVAKRGALFMIDLKEEVQKKGFIVAHIKTDSIKIPNATKEIINFVMEFGKKYGYEFEHEATYEKMCLVNDAVYIAKYSDGKHEFELPTGEKIMTEWTATGTQFQVPYVFKKLFAKKEINFRDLCEIKTVTSAFYLDMNEDLTDVSQEEKAVEKLTKAIKDKTNTCKISLNGEIKQISSNEYTKVIEDLNKDILKGHSYHFIGKAGLFSPIKPGCGGGLLMRENNGKFDSATGCKDYRWLESNVIKTLKKEDDIDLSYYDNLTNEAKISISQFGDFNSFSND